MKKGVKMVDMSLHEVSGVVGWCLGAYSEVENTYVHHIHTFLHTGSGLYNPLQQSHIVPRPHILYNISTTLYNTLQHSTVYSSTAFLQSTTSTTPLCAELCLSSAAAGMGGAEGSWEGRSHRSSSTRTGRLHLNPSR